MLLLLCVRVPSQLARSARRFFYSRGANCCLEIRTILGCDAAGPCLGYEGDCGDLQAQFAELQGPFLYSAAVGEPPTEQMSLEEYGAQGMSQWYGLCRY